MSSPSDDSIVTDTGPLISLERLDGGYEFRRRMYRRIIAPPTVWQDDLHLGELEAIALAQQLRLPLLIEEAVGRRAAKELGIPLFGLLMDSLPEGIQP